SPGPVIAVSATISPAPRASGSLPVQNVTPPSDATRTNRPCTRALRTVHGATDASVTSTKMTACLVSRFQTIHAAANGTKNSIAGLTRIPIPVSPAPRTVTVTLLRFGTVTVTLPGRSESVSVTVPSTHAAASATVQ